MVERVHHTQSRLDVYIDLARASKNIGSAIGVVNPYALKEQIRRIERSLMPRE